MARSPTMKKPLTTLVVLALLLGAAWLAFDAFDVSGGSGAAERAAPDVAGPERPTGSPPESAAEPRRLEAEASPEVATNEPAPEPAPAAPSVTQRGRVQVVINGTPAQAGRVDLWERAGSEHGSVSYISLDPESRPIGADGIATFDTVWEHGAEADVQLPGGSTLRTVIGPLRSPLDAAGDGRTHVVQLGTALVHGRVWDAAGEPAADEYVSCATGRGLRSVGRTDPGGYYRFTDLPAGRAQLGASLREGPSLQAVVELAVGESREVDLGEPGGLYMLRGRLLDVAGETVVSARPGAAVGYLRFVSGSQDANDSAGCSVAADGTFGVELPAGEYSVLLELQASMDQKREIATALIVSESRDLDLVVPGSRVAGQVNVTGAGHTFDPEHDGWAKLFLTEVVSEGFPLQFDALVGSDGRYAFHGVGEGRWTLSGKRLAEDPPTIQVGSEARSIELDLIVEQRAQR